MLVAATDAVVVASLHRATSRRLPDKHDIPDNRLPLLLQLTFPMATEGISSDRRLIEVSRQSSTLPRSSSSEARPTEDSDDASVGNSKSNEDDPWSDCSAMNGAKLAAAADCSISAAIGGSAICRLSWTKARMPISRRTPEGAGGGGSCGFAKDWKFSYTRARPARQKLTCGAMDVTETRLDSSSTTAHAVSVRAHGVEADAAFGEVGALQGCCDESLPCLTAPDVAIRKCLIMVLQDAFFVERKAVWRVLASVAFLESHEDRFGAT
ncbi:uncharacterized protein PG986_010611 [Apiospora aurea]|uniref:Uncharacterized protein n=1 Tax=Apiospora aurea TaxID=335848 RepID=A0ABR1Q2Q8_9PEZI